MSEEKKVVAPVEINDDELDSVAGGVDKYPADWDSLTIEQQRVRMVTSIRKKQLNMECEFYN